MGTGDPVTSWQPGCFLGSNIEVQLDPLHGSSFYLYLSQAAGCCCLPGARKGGSSEPSLPWACVLGNSAVQPHSQEWAPGDAWQVHCGPRSLWSWATE